MTSESAYIKSFHVQARAGRTRPGRDIPHNHLRLGALASCASECNGSKRDRDISDISVQVLLQSGFLYVPCVTCTLPRQTSAPPPAARPRRTASEYMTSASSNFENNDFKSNSSIFDLEREGPPGRRSAPLLEPSACLRDSLQAKMTSVTAR